MDAEGRAFSLWRQKHIFTFAYVDAFYGGVLFRVTAQTVRLFRQVMQANGARGWAAEHGIVASFAFFARFGTGEGRENRPQLRCGIVLQTPTVSANDAGKANRKVTFGEGEERGRARLKRANPKDQITNFKSKARVFCAGTFGVFAVWPLDFCVRGRAISTESEHPFRCVSRVGRQTFAGGYTRNLHRKNEA